MLTISARAAIALSCFVAIALAAGFVRPQSVEGDEVASPVLVMNTRRQAVPVRLVESKPFQAQVACQNQNATFCSGTLAAPAAQGLAVQYVSAECFFSDNSRVWKILVDSTLDGVTVTHLLNVLDHAGVWYGNVQDR